MNLKNLVILKKVHLKIGNLIGHFEKCYYIQKHLFNVNKTNVKKLLCNVNDLNVVSRLLLLIIPASNLVWLRLSTIPNLFTPLCKLCPMQ